MTVRQFWLLVGALLGIFWSTVVYLIIAAAKMLWGDMAVMVILMNAIALG